MNRSETLLEYDGGLLRFLMPGNQRHRVLVVESAAYLPRLRAMWPEAEIMAVVSDEDVPQRPELAGLDIAWTVLDYLETPLPFARESFDYILSDFCLDLSWNPQDIAAGLGLFLKQTGFLLLSFRNIRYWKILQNLMQGHYYGIVTRMFTQTEMERLLAASFYKEMDFLPVYHDAPGELLARLEAAGFGNEHGDLEAEYYLVRAARSMSGIARLKREQRPEVRRELSRLLHRIEYGIDGKENSARLWNLYRKEQMTAEYLDAFINEATAHPARVRARLGIAGDGRQQDEHENI